METPSILLTTEGTYPFHSGGVSVWCDKLIRELPEIDFHVLALTGAPSRAPLFSAPENLASTCRLALWGTEEPGAEEPLFSETYRKKMRTSPAVVRQEFLDSFETALRCLLSPGAAIADLADAIVRLHQYFREYDYARSMSSPDAWETFLRVCSEWRNGRSRLNLHDATCCMRWLQRYLAVLSLPYPRVNLVHASMAGFAGIPGVILKLLHGVPFLLTEHGVYLRELYITLGQSSHTRDFQDFLLTINESVIRMNYYFADAVTTLCEFNRKWQIRLGATPNRIFKAPNGVDEDVFFPRNRQAGDRPVVLTLSRILPLKGIDVLLKAALLVRDHIPDVRFRILGELGAGEYVEQCLRFIALNRLSPTVELGYTGDPASAYRTADLYCLPSISEAMPYSIIEAMLSGCPVVATDVGGVSELLGDTGRLVSPNAPESLAEAILDLLDGIGGFARRSRMAAAALTRARTQFTLRQATGRFRRLYNQLGVPLQGPYAIAEMPEPERRELSLVASC